MDIKKLYNIYLQNPSVQTDSRMIKPGDIFFALSGPNFNGNKFIDKALEAGASYCVGDAEDLKETEQVIKVEDALAALQELATVHRDSFDIPFVAITGSNGKTTTKELIQAVLSSSFICYTTTGNLNNHIGVPLTLLKVRSDAEIAVIEMGANHLHEIEAYCKWAKPTHGLITNVGKAHLEGFGSEEGIKKGKGELFQFLAANNGTAFINSDQDYMEEIALTVPHKIFFGTDKGEVTGSIKSEAHFLNINMNFSNENYTVKTQLVGDYNFPNALAAACIGLYFNVPIDKIIKALEAYQPDNSRSQFIELGSNKIIMDAYNANPNSMQAAIENFGKQSSDKKVIYLGAMKELGKYTEKEHAQLIDLLQKYQWNEVVLVGPEFGSVPPPFIHFTTTNEAALWFKQQQYMNSVILIKGSRSLSMENVLPK